MFPPAIRNGMRQFATPRDGMRPTSHLSSEGIDTDNARRGIRSTIRMAILGSRPGIGRGVKCAVSLVVMDRPGADPLTGTCHLFLGDIQVEIAIPHVASNGLWCAVRPVRSPWHAFPIKSIRAGIRWRRKFSEGSGRLGSPCFGGQAFERRLPWVCNS